MTRLILPFLALCTQLACVKAVPPSMAPDEVHTYSTDDGWVGALRHHPGDGPPVLLVHGMSANHYNWDYAPDVSPVDELVAAGFDVWVPELRGDPGSIGPSKRAHKEFDFDHHAEHDLPAAVDQLNFARKASDVSFYEQSVIDARERELKVRQKEEKEEEKRK